ncbi:MAG: hypothetical protein IJK26_09825 [Clostridia bacterium]|nr:hypothetical protein [Clostridia bacterium]
MRDIIIRAGLYKISTTMRGNIEGTIFPEGSIVFLAGQRYNRSTYIEGAVNGIVRSDMLFDLARVVSLFISPVSIPVPVNLSDKDNRRKLLIFLEKAAML